MSYKSFNYTHQFTMDELDGFGEDRTTKIREIMLNGLIRAMDRDKDLFETESVYDPISNTVRVRFGIHGIKSTHDELNESPPSMRPVYKTAYQEVEPLIFDTLKDAETIADVLLNLYEKYGFVTKAEFYDLVGVVSCFADMKYGWKDLNGMSIRRARGNPSKYEIVLPKPIELN